MNQKIKISQLPAKGSNLAAQDLLEIAEFTGTGYVSKSITGAEIAAGATAGFVPETRTLTINGVTQDLSADRTFTISTGITIGSTAITSGTVGRVLFQGTGNVVQQSSSLFWDNTNNRLGIGTSSPNVPLEVVGSNLLGIRTQISVNNAFDSIQVRNSSTGDTNQVRIKFDNENTVSSSSGGVIFYTGNNYAFFPQNSFGFWNHTSNGVIALATNNTERFRIFSTGNVAINTTTDAGFKLDVNGTARVSSNISGIYDGLNVRNSAGASNAQARIKFDNDITPTQTTTGGVVFYTSSVFSGFPSSSFGLWNYNSNGVIAFATNSTERLRIFSTGNIGINTTTDAGFRLDVNGTARFSGNVELPTTSLILQAGISGYAGSGNVLLGNNFNIRAMNASNTGTMNLIKANSLNNIEIGGSNHGNTFINPTLNSGQTVVVGDNVVVASAVLNVSSTTKGFLPPRMTTTQKNAIASPAAGLVVYDTTLNKLCVYTTAWETVTSL